MYEFQKLSSLVLIINLIIWSFSPFINHFNISQKILFLLVKIQLNSKYFLDNIFCYYQNIGAIVPDTFEMLSVKLDASNLFGQIKSIPCYYLAVKIWDKIFKH